MRVCPEDAISIDPEKNIAFIDTQKCTGCGLCVAGVVERVKGFEPSTSCLGSKHSTAELHPPKIKHGGHLPPFLASKSG